MGRKTKYNPGVLKQLVKYLDDYENQGDVVPTVEGLSDLVGVCKKTVYNWSQKPENELFLYALERLKTRQHRILLNKGLISQINTTLPKLMLVNNHGYSEKKEVKSENEIQVVQLQTHFGDEPNYESISNEQLEMII